MYVSEITQFIRKLKEQAPHIEAEQKKGRAIWWDRAPITPVEREKVRASTVAQQGYVYQVKG